MMIVVIYRSRTNRKSAVYGPRQTGHNAVRALALRRKFILRDLGQTQRITLTTTTTKLQIQRLDLISYSVLSFIIQTCRHSINRYVYTFYQHVPVTANEPVTNIHAIELSTRTRN